MKDLISTAIGLFQQMKCSLGEFIDRYVFYLSNFRDLKGEDFFFEPIGIIEHHGNTPDTGHYTCDVKDAETRNWYKTNDNTWPKMISSTDVSKKGYVVLFKKCS